MTMSFICLSLIKYSVLYSYLFNYKHIHLKLVIHTFDYTITKRAFKASNFNEHLLPIKLVTNYGVAFNKQSSPDIDASIECQHFTPT